MIFFITFAYIKKKIPIYFGSSYMDDDHES